MDTSNLLKQRAKAAMPGGVNSPVRAFGAVGGEPIFARRGDGARLETTDGRRLIDFCMSFGPLILGHAHPDVVRAVAEAATAGTSYAVTTETEIALAELIQSAFPDMDCLRLVNSGTEACMTAVRLARGATGRSKILKFSGCYHGHADCLLVKAGSGVAGIASASSAGVPQPCAGEMLVARYNHLEDATAVIDENRDDLAAVIMEPVAANMGLVPPRAEFLEGVVSAARQCGALVVFDEVITGFRLTFGGYQHLCGILPDLTILGKIIGGGMPVGALGGRRDVMEQLAPLGPVYQAGTLSGNPVSVAAGLATLTWLREHNPYPELERLTQSFTSRLRQAALDADCPVTIPQVGSLFGLFFRRDPVYDFDDAAACDLETFGAVFHALLEQDVYLPPSPFEASFVSIAHTSEILDQAADAFTAAFRAASGRA